MSTPRATWSTMHPSSATRSSLTSTTTRTKPAPIYNPYDKFTKPQFDAWIDDLTGTLRRALGHIDDDFREESPVVSDESSIGHIEAEQASESEEVDEDVEDSFAELKARRASRKGKGRDPREGPGLFASRGNGSYEEPIDLASDSEDEEAQVEELARVVDDIDDGSEWDEQDEQDEQDGHEQGEQDVVGVDAEADAEVEYEDEVNYDEEAGSDLEEKNEVHEDDEDEERPDMWRSDQSYSPPVQYEVLDADDEDYVEKSDEPEVIELLSDEEVIMEGSSPPAQGDSERDSDADVDEEDQVQGAHKDVVASPEIYDVDDDDEQPLYDDTAFPPTVLDYPSLHETVEIVDPWVRPQLYANDLYKGGDHLPDPESHPNPHKLGDADATSTSITPQREMDEHIMAFELIRDISPEAASHLRSQSLDASYIQYDPESVDVDSSNTKKFNSRPDEREGEDMTSDSSADVSNRRPDERHPGNITNDNDVKAHSINLEQLSNDNVEDLSLSAEDMHGQVDESNIRAGSPEPAMSVKQHEELTAVSLVNTEEITFDLYEDLEMEADGLTVEVTEQPVTYPILDRGDGADVQGSQDVPMSPEQNLREDHGSNPPHLFIKPLPVPEVLAVAELEAPQHLSPGVACVAGLTHHQPSESELSPAEGQDVPTDIAPQLKELPEGDRGAEGPAFLPTPPAEEHTSSREDTSPVLNQVHSILDDTNTGDDSEPQEAKHEPSFVTEAVDHDTMDSYDENHKFVGADISAVAPEPAVVHIKAASDIVELNDDHGRQEVVVSAEISNQDIIAADENNHTTVIPPTQSDGITALVGDVLTIDVDDNSAALKPTMDTDESPAKESLVTVTRENCTALVNDGIADAIGNSPGALAHGGLTLPFEEGLAFELLSVVPAGDDSHVCVDKNSVVRVDNSVVPRESTATLIDDGAVVPDEQSPSSPVDDSSSAPPDNITTSPADASVPIDKVHTVDADMVVEVSPQSPPHIEVNVKTTTDTSPTPAPPDIASSPPATSGSPAPADPHTPPTQPQIQTGFSPLFTPRTYTKRRPPGLMTTPPSSEGDTSDDVRSPSQHDGKESQRGPEMDPVLDPTREQITLDSQDALVGMKPSDSTSSFRPRRESLTRPSHVVPTIRARAMSVLQPDPYPYSLSTPGATQYLGKSGSDEVSEDENENDLSNTSSSSNDRELEPDNQGIPDSQDMLEPSVDAHVESEIPTISADVQTFKDSKPPLQSISLPDNPAFTGPLSPIEDLTDIESSPKKVNGVSSITPRQIPQVVIKTEISSAKYQDQNILNPESPTLDRSDVQGSASTKRKRKSTSTKRLSHTLSSKRKGKQKEDPNGSPAPSDTTSPGGLAAKLLTYSRKSSVSRASSSTPSEASVATSQVPPTPTRPANAHHRPPVHYPPALLHGHSSQPRLRHRHHLPTAGPSRASSTSSLDRPLYYSSPVTRSNCRYRRISLPKVENGPRISFLVPGCSLGDAELMEDEEIIDHGDATTDESRRVVPDIENLDFSPYLIGVLRQLVGVDLLREQEVYYLCAVGEDPRLVQKKKADRFTVNRIGESSNSPRPSSDRSPSSSIRPPVSAASAVSATPSGIVVKKEDDGYESSISLSTVESHAEPAPRPAKRQKTSADTPSSASISRTKPKGPTKRSLKPIAYISAPVVPVPEEEDSDLSGSELPFDHRPKAGLAKGLKRARTDVRADEEEGRRFKKLKGRLSDTH